MDLINTQRQGRFIRRTGHSLKVGKVVAYTLTNMGQSPFQVTIHRGAIEIQGAFTVGPEGIEVIRDILARAIKHHEHLKSFAIGEKQTVLDEAGVFNDTQMQTFDTTTVQ